MIPFEKITSENKVYMLVNAFIKYGLKLNDKIELLPSERQKEIEEIEDEKEYFYESEREFPLISKEEYLQINKFSKEEIGKAIKIWWEQIDFKTQEKQKSDFIKEFKEYEEVKAKEKIIQHNQSIAAYRKEYNIPKETKLSKEKFNEFLAFNGTGLCLNKDFWRKFYQMFSLYIIIKSELNL